MITLRSFNFVLKDSERPILVGPIIMTSVLSAFKGQVRDLALLAGKLFGKQ